MITNVAVDDGVKQWPVDMRSIASSWGVFGTTIGLKKENNEDRIDCRIADNGLRCCVADGHWGATAAEYVVASWQTMPFPDDRAAAVRLVTDIQLVLSTAFGKPQMDAESDRPPETAFVGIKLQDNELRIASYGDCRLLVVRDHKIEFVLETKETWLGAFSQLGLRDRLSVEDGLVYAVRKVCPGDVILLFTDGIDECRYGQITISNEMLAGMLSADLSASFRQVMTTVFGNGAEDNASLALVRAKS